MPSLGEQKTDIQCKNNPRDNQLIWRKDYIAALEKIIVLTTMQRVSTVMHDRTFLYGTFSM